LLTKGKPKILESFVPKKKNDQAKLRKNIKIERKKDNVDKEK